MFTLFKENLQFLLTNRIPRMALSSLMAKVSQIENPLFVKPALWLWQSTAQMNLEEAELQRFKSIQHCFTRALKPGARTIDACAHFVSPCDGILGAHGLVNQGCALQIKGMPYSIAELLGNPELALQFEGYRYITIRITASMYHRFHSPAQAQLLSLKWIAGDCWNVTPITLKRIEKLFCRNHRAVLRMQLPNGEQFAVVPVAAVLVGAMRMHAIDRVLNQHSMNFTTANFKQSTVAMGEEMGWFEHGSTVVMLIPSHYTLAPNWIEGSVLRMGQALAEESLPTE